MDMEPESEKNAKDDSKASGPHKLKDRVALNKEGQTMKHVGMKYQEFS